MHPLPSPPPQGTPLPCPHSVPRRWAQDIEVADTERLCQPRPRILLSPGELPLVLL